jgi:hypothetical protein
LNRRYNFIDAKVVVATEEDIVVTPKAYDGF